MALGYTFVDFEALEAAIKQLETTKDSLATQLKTIKGVVDGSVNNPEIIYSEDARVLKDEFENMYSRWAKKFDNYVQEYIDYFKEAEQTYRQRGDKGTREAQQLNSFIN